MLSHQVGASLYASDIGANAFIGMSGSGAASGIAVASYNLTVRNLFDSLTLLLNNVEFTYITYPRQLYPNSDFKHIYFLVFC